MTALEEFKKFKDEHWMTTDHLLFEAQHRGNEAIAEVYRSLERAEAALAELGQCPDQNEYPYSNLRTRAEEGSGEDCPECGKWMYGAECLSRGHKHPDNATDARLGSGNRDE